MKMKKIIFAICMLLMAFSPNKANAQGCELPLTYDTSFGKILSQAIELGFTTTKQTVKQALDRIVSALNDETTEVMQAVQKYQGQTSTNRDAMNQLAVTRNRQVAGTRAQLYSRPPDTGDKACAKATNSKNWTRTRQITKSLAKNNRDLYAKQNNKMNKTADGAAITVDNHTKWFSNIDNEIDPTAPANPFENADINFHSITGPNTYREIASYKGMPSSDNMPNTYIAAQQCAKNLVGNKGISRGGKTETEKAKFIRTSSRKNLAYSAFADMLAKRSTVPGSNTGVWLRSFYSKLGVEGTGYSSQMAKNIHNDLSEQELNDHLYSKMYTNPDWVISLEQPTKQLQMEQLDIVNKNMALEWDILLSLEKLATIDGVNLATELDNSAP